MANIRKLRTSIGVSVQELSKSTGIPTATIFAWENGTRDIRRATLENAAILADALGINVADLLEVKT